MDIQNRVNTALGRLPAAVKTTGVTITKSSQNFVLGAAVYSPDDRYTPLFMSNYLDVYVRDTLKRVPGVADVIIFGERKYSMRLWLDPVRMASRGLTATDVVNALQEQNVEVAAGQVGQPPIKTGQQFQISVRAIGRLSEPVQFENIILKTNADGTLVRLKDVGRAELGAEDYSSDLVYNGHRLGGYRRHPTLDRQCHRRRPEGTGRAGPALQALPAGNDLRERLRHHRSRQRIDPGRARHPDRSHRPGDSGDLHLSGRLAQHHHSRGHDSGLADRNLRLRQAAGISRSTR